MKAIFVSGCVVLVAVFGFAQSSQTGFPPFSSQQALGFDTINQQNLNVHFSIPVISLGGRGMNFQFPLTYDSTIWVNSSNVWTPIVDGMGNPSWGWNKDAAVGSTSYRSPGKSCHYQIGGQQYIDTTTHYLSYAYTDGAGTKHSFNLDFYADPTYCNYNTGPVTGYATDGSGYYLDASLPDAPVITVPSGKKIPINGAPTDANGNYFSKTLVGGGETDWTDTLGNTALKVIYGTNTVTYTYTSPAGTSASFTVNYQSKSVRTNFGCSGVSEYYQPSINLVSSITLPDSTSYSFTYETTPGYSTSVTGRLASVQLPTGGTINYTYSGSNNGIICADGTAAGLSRQDPAGTWAYARSGSAPAWTTTITDPQNNQTVLNFQGLYETQRQVYQGSSGTGTLLQTAVTCYNGNNTNCTTTGVTLPIARRAVFAKLPDSSGLVSETDTQFNSYGLPTETDEYDYGSGAAGTLIRQTLTTYGSYNAGSCVALTNGIVDHPCQITVKDGSGNTKAQTTFTYDEGSVTATTGTLQHNSVTGSRGNPTTVSNLVQGTTTLTRHFTYFDTGNVNVATDVNTAQTAYGYGTGSCGNSFPTQINQPLSLSRSMAWNCTGGVMTSVTDENNQTSSTTYSDASFWRPASSTDQAGNQTSITYSGATVLTSSLSLNSGASVAEARKTLDNLGRLSVNQTRQAPGSTNYDSVETDYDSLGRPYKVSLPYSGTVGQTDPSWKGVTTSYDALGRPTLATDSGGGMVTTTYNKNDVLSVVGPAPAGENTKQRQLEYDGLGRLKSVCEKTSASGSGTCTQTNSLTGYWTKYTYDVLGNLTGVTQNAQGTAQTRSYAYDNLGRMTSEINPESGTTYYTYDTDGTCGTYTGDLVKRVDAVGNTTCYKYDSLHRVTSVTYSGSYASATSTKCYVYDSATVNGQNMAYPKGRLAEAYTTSSASCPGSGKLTDLGFSYSARGELADTYESTPHSGGYYHSTAAYWETGALKTLNPLNSTALPTFTYSADGEGRPSSVTATAGTNPVSSTGYNVSSQPTGVTFGTADSDAFTFDSNTGRMTQYQFTVGSTPKTVTGQLGWNANGTLTSLNITDQFYSPNTQNCAYSHDDLGRISSVNCGTLASTWNANGGANIYHLCGRADGDGWSATVGLDSAPCWLQYGPYTTQLTSAGNYLAQWTLMVDNNTADDSQVVWVDVTAWNGTTLTQLAGIYITRTQFNFPNVYQTFSVPFYLDSAHAGQQIQYRVLWLGPSYVKEKSLDYDTDTIWSQTFGYDPFGNISKSGNATFNVAYDQSKNQVGPGQAFTYDANGNATHDNVHPYSWDAEGHVVTIDNGTSNKVCLTYDALGRMAEQAYGSSCTSSYTEILYGPTGGKLALMNGQAVTKAFIPLPAGATAVYTSGPTLSYFRHPDWLGSSRFASTASRTLYYSGAYAPFGENYAESGTDRSFTGQNQDTVAGSTTGLYDFMYREYAQYGRWISPDPAGVAAVNPAYPQTWNRYAYVANIPMTATDPLGLFTHPLPSLPGNISIRSNSWLVGCGASNLVLEGISAWVVLNGCPDEQYYTRLVFECDVKGICYDSGVKLVAASQNSTANNAPLVPKNPCQYQGRALAPSDYATMGKNAPWYSPNFALDVEYGWGTGQYMDAQPLTSVPATWKAAAYGNYVYGVYMQAAGVPLSVALRGAEYYALKKTYPTGTPMQPGYPGLPAANAQNIINGYNAQANGTTCQATPTPLPPPPGG